MSSLFADLPEAAPEWTAFRPAIGKGAEYTHTPSGWKVKHCGHPTANWPYYLVDPAHPGTTTVTHNGRGWRGLDGAKAAVLGILDGSLVTTDEQCVPGVRRVVRRRA